MDEPLSNLDAKLRVTMRDEIAQLYRDTHPTVVYVTHDQTEAMILGTRIVVMKDGVIQQVDTPQQLYLNPCNVFVAGFIGSPQMNIMPAKLQLMGDSWHVVIAGSTVQWTVDGRSSRSERVSPRAGEATKQPPIRSGAGSSHAAITPEIQYAATTPDTTLSFMLEQTLRLQPDVDSGEQEVLLGIRPEHLHVLTSPVPASTLPVPAPSPFVPALVAGPTAGLDPAINAGTEAANAGTEAANAGTERIVAGLMANGNPIFTAEVIRHEVLGAEGFLHVSLFGEPFVIKTYTDQTGIIGAKVDITFDPKDCYFFDRETGKTLLY
jgi:energy-coupling factor transporter ATP-binding protein EcfA2